MDVLLLDLEGTPEKSVQWDKNGILIVGSARQCDLQIEEDNIGPIQCYIQHLEGDHYKLVHVDPDSETLYQGKSISQVSIQSGEMFQIPSFLVSLQEDSGGGDSSSQPSESPAKASSERQSTTSRSTTASVSAEGTSLTEMSPSQKTETEDRVLKRFLLREGVVSEQTIKETQVLQEMLEEDGIYLSLGELLCLQNHLSEKKFQNIDRHLRNHMESYEETIPHYMKHAFINDPDFPRTALKQNLITSEQHQQARQVQQTLEEKNIYLPLGEILLKWEFLKLSKAKALELSAQSKEKTGGAVSGSSEETEQEEEVEGVPELSDLSYTDRTTLEELVRQDKIVQEQVPVILEKAYEQQGSESFSSSLRNVLTGQGIVDEAELSQYASTGFSRVQIGEDTQKMGFGLKVAAFLLCFVAGGAAIILLGSQESQAPTTETATNTQQTPPPVPFPTERTGEEDESSTDESDQTTQEAQPEPKQEPLKIPEKNGVFLAEGNHRFTFSVRISPKKIGLTNRRIFMKLYLENHPVFVSAIQLNHQNSYYQKQLTPFHNTSSKQQNDLFPHGLYNIRIFYPPNSPPQNLPDSIYLAAEEHINPLTESFESFLSGDTWNIAVVKPYGSRSQIEKSRQQMLQFLQKRLDFLLASDTPFSRWKQKLAQVFSSRKNPSSETYVKLTQRIEQDVKKNLEELKNLEQKYRVLPFKDLRKQTRKLFRTLPEQVYAITRKGFQKHSEGPIPRWLKDKGVSQMVTLPKLAEQVENLKNEMGTKAKESVTKKLIQLTKPTLRNLQNSMQLLAMLEKKQAFIASFPYLSKGEYATIIQFVKFMKGYLQFQKFGLEFSSFKPYLPQDRERKKVQMLMKMPELLRKKTMKLVLKGLTERDLKVPKRLIPNRKAIKKLSLTTVNERLQKVCKILNCDSM